jgi:putative heme-binding domain-containing protein
MYRYVIEHPEWIPQEWQKKLDLRAGHDKGRIYRVYPKGKTPREMVRLDRLGAHELVKALDSPNGWTRDTAQHLLTTRLQSRDGQARAIHRKLLSRLDAKLDPRTRLHVLCLVGELSGEDSATAMVTALDDPHPAIRKRAIGWLQEYVPRARIDKLIADPDPQVRLELAYTAPAGDTLATLVRNNANDRYVVAAALSSVQAKNCPQFLYALLQNGPAPDSLLASLLKLSSVYGDSGAGARLIAAQLAGSNADDGERMIMVASLLESLQQNRMSLEQVADERRHPKLRDQLNAVIAAARRIAADPKSPLGDKTLAIRLLGRGVGDQAADQKLLASFLTPQVSEDIQVAALARLGDIVDPRVPHHLFAAWKGLSPMLRTQAVDVLLGRTEWTRLTLEALQQRKILPSEIDAIRRQKLLDHRDAEVRKTAARIFAASSDPDRAKLVSRYQISLPPQGDAARGSKHFAKHCAACHQLGGIGQQVGPELASVGDKSPEGLLSAILDPNRAVEARYVNYLASTTSGVTVSGLLQGETSTTITLVAADGKKHDLLRKDIDELTSTGKSVMPEGFEKELPPADMADLIAFLRGHLAKPKVFAGNRPETVKAGADGVLRLTAASAAVFGKTLVFEEKHQNLGYWSSPDDHAIWTVEVPQDGRYEVWLDFACDPSAAGNTLALQAGDAQLTHQVRSTASWDLYRKAKAGVLRLPAGRHEIIVRPEGSIRGALIDLKAIELKLAE